MTLDEVKACTILKVLVGSEAYGLKVDDEGDRDEKGVLVEPLEEFFDNFEQYSYRTAVEREGKDDAHSGPGDLDLEVYSMRKFLHMALKGNPNITEIFFLKDFLTLNALGAKLLELRPHIVSKYTARATLGYMNQQRAHLINKGRPHLVAKYGYDVKFATHLLRLGYQATTLLVRGTMELPFTGEIQDYLRSVRTGKVPLANVLQEADDYLVSISGLIKSSEVVPDEPNRDYVKEWMVARYWEMWKAQRVHLDRSGDPYPLKGALSDGK